MPAFCAVINCTNRSERDKKSFFRIPAIPTKGCELKKQLCVLRRTGWLLALKRADLTEKQINYFRICNDHFISGKPADIYDFDNPDWVPSRKMGYAKREGLCKDYAEEVKNFSKKKLLIVSHRKKSLVDEKISASISEAANSHIRTNVLMERSIKQEMPFQESDFLSSENTSAANTSINQWSIKQEMPFQVSEILSSKNNCSTSTSFNQLMHSRSNYVSETGKRTLNERDTAGNLKKKQNPIKENYIYKNLVDNLLLIKKPNDFWGISLHSSSVICARWNEDYNCVKRVIIDNSLTVKVFLREWNISLSELMNITCTDDISNLLRNIENYEIDKV